MLGSAGLAIRRSSAKCTAGVQYPCFLSWSAAEPDLHFGNISDHKTFEMDMDAWQFCMPSATLIVADCWQMSNTIIAAQAEFWIA